MSDRATSTSDCPDDNALLRWVDGNLGEAARERVEAHLSSCRECRHLVALMQAPDPTVDAPDTQASAGREDGWREVAESARIGRYVLLRRLGSGGMGEVFLAYDPRLDRDVAIKRIRSDAVDDDERRARFQREARVAARLNHPAIVQVHDLLGVLERERT